MTITKNITWLASLVLAACATVPVPADKLGRAQSSVRAAEEMNAEADPDATLHLKLAREQLTRATQILKDGDNGRAAGILLRAEADADAALDLARARSARIEAEKTLKEVREAKARMQEGSKS